MPGTNQSSETNHPAGTGDYVVRAGDCISSIAQNHGFFWETVWDDPGNAELKQARKSPNVLLPGDRVTIPEFRTKEESCAAAQRHTFKKKNVPAYLSLQLTDEDGNPRAGLDYALAIDGELRTGQTDGEGRLEEPIPPHAREAQLRVFPPESDESPAEDEQTFTGPAEAQSQMVQQQQDEAGEVYEIVLGATDPIESIAGAQERLINLGYDLDDVTGELDDPTRAAVRAFQQGQELEETGELDSTTLDRLEEAHGS